jgi:DNA polymerase II large subunit
MSRYELGRLFFDACRDRDTKLVMRYREDPESVLAEYQLSDGERGYVRDADIRAIYEAGVPPLLVRMGVNAFLPGIDTPTYKQMIDGAVQTQD